MKPERLTIHCSDSPNGKRVDISEIERWHKARGFEKVGYHLVIQPDGEVQRGRSLNEIGAHVAGYNRNNIGICLVGKDQFTRDQFAALRYHIEGLFLNLDGLKPWSIHCHHQFDAAKTCPNIPVNNLLYWLWAKDDRSIQPYILEETS